VDDFVLRLDRISKSFGGLRVLNNLDMQVGREEMVGLIGPNGAGKSTVFNVITSFYKPESGHVIFLGSDITGKNTRKVCHLGISRTYQLVRTFLKMTALENVWFPLSTVGLDLKKASNPNVWKSWN